MLLFITVILLIITTFYWKVIQPRKYWKKLGINQITFGGLFKENYERNSYPELVQHVYDKTTDRYLGIYQFMNPVLAIKDLNLIRQIAVKDFDHFTDHLTIMTDDQEPIWSKNLIFLKGADWKAMRATLSPAFTSSKMRTMFGLMEECTKKFVKHFEDDQNTISVNFKEIIARYANDVIASCAFGVECDSMANKENEFYMMGKNATNFTGLRANIKILFLIASPKLFKLLGFTLFPQNVKTFFYNLVKTTISMREEKNIYRPDMINLLIEAKNGKLQYNENQESIEETGFATAKESEIGMDTSAASKRNLSMIDMTAQAFVFFFGGFESVSSAMSFMAYELAVNPDVQERLFQEIQDTLNECDGKLTYEALNKMKYLDMVVSETLRKWPIAASVDRIATKTYTIEPELDTEIPLTLEKGTAIWIPIWGLQHDPKYFPNPDKFDPERFSDENKGNIKPYTYLPFGVGPRNCIASRFALLEVKCLFFHLLSKCEIVVIDKTPIPFVFSKNGFIIAPEKGFWVGIKKRS